jgi:hypothetical protein
MNKENQKNKDDISQLGNVDQIREILFGSESRELKERFEKIENNLKSMQDEMRKKFEQSQTDFEERIDAEIEAISKKLKNIVTSQQDEFADVRDASLKLEKRLKNSMETMEDELNAKREQLHKQQIDMRNTLRAQMDTLQDELLGTLEAKLSEVGDVKLSRDDAADILMEAAMAMKGTKINQQLSMAEAQPKK